MAVLLIRLPPPLSFDISRPIGVSIEYFVFVDLSLFPLLHLQLPSRTSVQLEVVPLLVSVGEVYRV